MIAVIASTSALVIPAAPARAADPAWTIDRLMAALRRTTSDKVDFRETKTLAALKSPLVQTGTLVFRQPAFLEKHVKTPFDERYTVEGDQLTMVRRSGRPITLSLASQPVLWAFIESIRGTLSGDAAALERFYKLELEGDASRWSLTLLPSQIEMVDYVRFIRITGSQGKPSTIEILEPNGDRSLMTLAAAK